MPTRHLVLGLDGADLSVVRAMGPEKLPVLHRLMSRGAYAALQSVQPPATLPNWTTFLTGADPGRHGVFDFTLREGYQVRFTGGTVRETPTLFERLDALGRRCACIAFPATYPPPRLRHGVHISGWDSPVAFEADRSFVWPPSLHDTMRARFGPWRFDDADEMNADQPGWHARLPGLLEERIRRKVDVARWLLERETWDVFALYFGESDTAAHHLWAFHDPSSPRAPDRGDRGGLERVYRALDEAAGALIAEAGDDVELTIVSDHGSGGSSDVVLHLNRALADAGLLQFRAGRSSWGLVDTLKELALTRLPPKLRERIFRLAGGRLPGMLESRARFGAIAMESTRAFSDELNYFPGIWLNLAGREPSGIVPAAERDATAREVERALLALRDPWSGAPVVETVWRREELYTGPYLERAPDLLLRLALRPYGEGRYSYNVQPSGGPGPVFRRLERGEHLGKKGRSLQGSHRERGLFIAAGPRVQPVGEIDAHIADASATLLARMDVAVDERSAGRVLWEALDPAATETTTLPDVASRPSAKRGDEIEVERRLRALGYVD